MCVMACTSMTKSNEIGILRADNIVELSQASCIGTNIGLEILLLGCRSLPSVNQTPIENQKFQNTAEKTGS